MYFSHWQTGGTLFEGRFCHIKFVNQRTLGERDPDTLRLEARLGPGEEITPTSVFEVIIRPKTGRKNIAHLQIAILQGNQVYTVVKRHYFAPRHFTNLREAVSLRIEIRREELVDNLAL